MAGSPDFKYNRTISDVIKKSNKKHILPETSWNWVGISTGEANVPFESGWDQAVGSDITTFVPSHDGSPVEVAWYHAPDGEVRLRGMAQATVAFTPGSTIFTLPTEARPETTQVFVVAADSGTLILDLSTIRFRAWVAGQVGE